MHVDSTAKPKSHSVTLIMRQRVEAELDRLENLGIISPVQIFSIWAAPLVTVRKRMTVLESVEILKLTECHSVLPLHQQYFRETWRNNNIITRSAKRFRVS